MLIPGSLVLRTVAKLFGHYMVGGSSIESAVALFNKGVHFYYFFPLTTIKLLLYIAKQVFKKIWNSILTRNIKMRLKVNNDFI